MAELRFEEKQKLMGTTVGKHIEKDLAEANENNEATS